MDGFDTYRLLFQETVPISLGPYHYMFADKLLLHKEGILQSNLAHSLKWHKSLVSKIKGDLLRLGWIESKSLGIADELRISGYKEREVRMFLGQWQMLKQCLMVRPHSIKVLGGFKNKPPNDYYIKALNTLKSKYPGSTISLMNNNKQYNIKTEYGTIVMKLNGALIEFWVKGFILPIKREDVILLQEYILEGIEYRLNHMRDIVKEHFHDQHIAIYEVVALKNLHTGILTKKNAAKALGIVSKLKKLGLRPDNSIPPLDEWETEGTLDLVSNKLRAALITIFNAEEQIINTDENPF